MLSWRTKQPRRAEEVVLVLGALGPGRHQVGELEAAGGPDPGGDEAVLALVDQAVLAPAEVLPDVVEVDVDRGGRAPGAPVPRRGLEDDLHVAAVEGVAPDQPGRPQGQSFVPQRGRSPAG